MPSSRPNAIPIVLQVVSQLQPASILDVGVGFGKWGHLFREYTDIVASEHAPARYRRENWQVVIDGIEGFSGYITDMHRFLYNNIYLGDAADLLPTLPNYDLIFLGDVIEHFEKPQGEVLLRAAIEKAERAVIVSTPKYETGQAEICENELERHRSLWSVADFRRFPRCRVTTVCRTLLLAVVTKPGVTPPRLAPRAVGKPPSWTRRLRNSLATAVLGRSSSRRLDGHG